MPKYTLARTVIEYYEVDARTVDEAIQKYVDDEDGVRYCKNCDETRDLSVIDQDGPDEEGNDAEG